jgi:hypothetical protein
MRRYLTKPKDVMLREEAAMRAFYRSCGISPQTTEAAILARRNKPYDETKPSVFKGKRRRRSATLGGATKALRDSSTR